MTQRTGSVRLQMCGTLASLICAKPPSCLIYLFILSLFPTPIPSHKDLFNGFNMYFWYMYILANFVYYTCVRVFSINANGCVLTCFVSDFSLNMIFKYLSMLLCGLLLLTAAIRSNGSVFFTPQIETIHYFVRVKTVLCPIFHPRQRWTTPQRVFEGNCLERSSFLILSH